jgi:HEPN domain-containing protein
MKTNISLAKNWIISAISDIKRIIKDFETEDFADIAFRSQFAVEKLNKSIIGLLGLKVQKTHEPTKILKSILHEDSRKFNKNSEDLILQLITFSILFEEEGTKTRYGITQEDDFLLAEEIYTSFNDIKKFIQNLEKIITIHAKIIGDVFNIKESTLEDLINLKNLREELIKWI